MSNTLALSPARAQLARVISDIFSPPVLAVPGLLLGVWASGASDGYRFAFVYFVVGVVLPVSYVVWLLKSGRINDFHLPDRSDRRGPFLASLVCGAVGVGLLIGLGAPSSIVAPIITLLVQILLLFLITLGWQVSVHTATTAGLITFACLAFGPAAAFALWLLPLVAWARIYLGRHTLTQTLAGACLGSTCFLALFALRGIVW